MERPARNCGSLARTPVTAMTAMSTKEMQPGSWYLVTRASRNREFQVGDRIKMCADGSIDVPAAAGWMPAEDVPDATRGMRVRPEPASLDGRPK